MSSPQASPVTPPSDSSFWARYGQMAAMSALTVVIFVATLVVQPKLWQGERWIPFTVAMVLFAILSNRTAHAEYSARVRVLLLVGQAATVLTLMPLSDWANLIPILTFISVSLSQLNLSHHWANAFDVALLVAITLISLAGKSWVAALQTSAVYAAGYVFIIAFTRTAQRERQARTQLETLYRHLERANQQLAEYAGQAEQIATFRERNRLARDVHDSLGHYLTVLNVQLEIVTKFMDADPAVAHTAARRAKEIAAEGLAEVRRSVAALRPSPLDGYPLPEAIRRLADDTRQGGLAVSFEQTGLVRSLPAESETVLYRAAQESLTNVLKHAHARGVALVLAYESEAACLQVRDDGIGRIPQSSPDSIGLSGLRDRVAALHGAVRAENHPAGGFEVEVRLPYGIGQRE